MRRKLEKNLLIAALACIALAFASIIVPLAIVATIKDEYIKPLIKRARKTQAI